jgi:hypothetical protein
VSFDEVLRVELEFLHRHAKTNERQMTVFSAYRTALFIDGANLHSTAETLEQIYFG